MQSKEHARESDSYAYFRETPPHRYSSEAVGTKGRIQCCCPGLRRRLAGVNFPSSTHHEDVTDWKASSNIIAVFHTNAGHVTLNDDSYNTERMVATGNPYKHLVADLMKRGVQIELCGATATVHHWGNADLLPGVKVNTDAMARMSQLVQEGFVQITEWD